MPRAAGVGVGPIGDMTARIERQRGQWVIAADLVPERLARVRERGAETLDLNDHGDGLANVVLDLTDGRGADVGERQS